MKSHLLWTRHSCWPRQSAADLHPLRVSGCESSIRSSVSIVANGNMTLRVENGIALTRAVIYKVERAASGPVVVSGLNQLAAIAP